jgi:hypothetical protein
MVVCAKVLRGASVDTVNLCDECVFCDLIPQPSDFVPIGPTCRLLQAFGKRTTSHISGS